jgi:hypothetical protein
VHMLLQGHSTDQYLLRMAAAHTDQRQPRMPLITTEPFRMIHTFSLMVILMETLMAHRTTGSKARII